MTRSDLIKRLEETEGPSRELDRDLTAFFYPGEDLQWPDQYKATSEHWRKRRVEHLTSSIDAAVELVEKVKPGAYGFIQFGMELNRAILLQDRSVHEADFVTIEVAASGTAEHRYPAIALLIALLRSLEKEKA